MAHNYPELRKRALLLSYFTVGYNLVEGVVSVLAGLAAGSIALIGFGLDSAIESLSGGVMIWRFGSRRELTEDNEERIEHLSTRLVGVTFLVLGAYVLYESVAKLISREQPDPSLLGIIIAIVSLIVMPVLFSVKLHTGQKLGSKSLIADAKETLACSLLSAALLIGLSLNYLFGLWWADPVAGLIIVAFLAKEGLEAFFGEE